jgi:transposase
VGCPRVRTRYFQRNKNRVCRGHGGVACVPCFIFPKSQLERIKPFFPRSHGAPRVDDRRVVSGIIYVIKHGLQWKDAPDEYGPHKTLYNRFIRWSRFCVFNKIFTELANKTSFDGSLMIDSTHLKAHRTAASLLKKGILRAS